MRGGMESGFLFYKGLRMTTKQMADAAGVSTDTVTRKIKELFPQLVENRKKTVLNQGQALKVMSEIRKVNFVQPQNALELPQTASDARLDRLEAITEKLLLTMGNMMLAMQSNQKPVEQASLPAPKLSSRDELRMIVNKASKTSGDYSGAWKTLYTEIYYRLHINATERAKNAKTTAIEILDAEGLLDSAVAIAKEIF